jgi:elongation factor Tu
MIPGWGVGDHAVPWTRFGHLDNQSTKPTLSIGLLGHLGHGKSVLTAAISSTQAEKKLADRVSLSEIAQAPEEVERGIRIATAQVEVRTARRRYVLSNGRRHVDIVKGLITGAVPMHAAILVVSMVNGPTAQSREHVRLARLAQIPHIIVFLNGTGPDGGPKALGSVELNIRELLSSYDYDGENVRIIKGSASQALESTNPSDTARIPVADLLDELDRLPLPTSLRDHPFLMPVEDVFYINGRGTVATGRIQRGTVVVGSQVELVGLGASKMLAVTGIEMYRRILDSAQAGDNVGLFVPGVDKDGIERGMVLAAPGTATPYTQFDAEVYLSESEEGGRDTPILKRDRYRPQFYFWTTDV